MIAEEEISKGDQAIIIMTGTTIEIMIGTVGLAETIVDQATDQTMGLEITTDRETLMDQDPTMDPITDHAITMGRAITTDQDPTMAQDQTIDHRKEAILDHLNPNLTLHKKIALNMRAIFS